MRRKDRLSIIFWKHLKFVCLGNFTAKIIPVPFTILLAWILSLVVNQAVSGQVKMVVRYSLFMLALIVIFFVIQSISNILIRKRQLKAVNQCRIDFLENLLNNPLDQLFQTQYGELTENLNSDMETLVKRYIELYPNMLSGVLGVLGYFLFLLFQSPLVAVSLLGISLLQLILPVIVRKYMQINYDQCRDIEAQITDHVMEAVNGFEVIKLYDLKQWWLTRMAECQKTYLSAGRKADAIAAAQRSMYRLLDYILKFGTCALMGIFALLGYSTFDIAVQGIYLSAGLFDSVKTLFSTVPEIAVSQKAELRINKWSISGKSEKKSWPESIFLSVTSITIKNLKYKYKNSSVIDGLNYRFDSDKNYIIQGKNGAGKSTLIHLLAGLILPEQGEIFTPESDIPFGESALCLLIPQKDPEYSYDVHTLFSMFDGEKQRLLFSTAKRFGLTEDVMKGNSIRDLSGGERKKVFLSIGFAVQPQWLFLDEPSNNLDRHGKEILLELIRERKGTVIVSHDDFLIHSADCRLKLENGRIYEENK